MRELTIILGVLHALALEGAAQPPGISWLREPADSWIDIERDYGCKSIDQSPGFDNAPLLNQCFEDAGRRHFARIVIPGKAYRIDDTVRIPDRTAIAIVGSAAVLALEKVDDPARLRGDPQHDGPTASRLVWYGPQNRAMIEYHGYGLYWNGVSLIGRQPETSSGETSGERASIGMLIRKAREGIGTGKLYVPNMWVSECISGVQFGVEEKDQNADTGLFASFTAHNCHAGICVKHHMGLGFVVQSYQQSDTQTAFRFDFGGRLRCRRLRLTGPGRVLSIGKPRVGGASYHIDDVIVDKSAVSSDGFRLVEMDRPSPAMICMSGKLPQVPYNFPIALLKGSASLTLRNLHGLRAGAIVCESAHVLRRSNNRPERRLVGPIVRLDSCRLDVSNPQQVIAGQASGRRWSLSWSGCANRRSDPIADGVVRRGNRPSRQ